MNKKLSTSKRALFFTVDALIAALILISGLLLITASYVSEQPTSLINHLSQDLMNVLGEIKIYELNNSYVDELIANGSITDINNTALMQVGSFWTEDKVELAERLIANITEGLLPDMYGYSIAIEGDTLFTTTNPVTSSLISSGKIVSGIEKSKPIKGFVARAKATSVSKTTSITIPFAPAGAGWKGSAANPGKVQVEKIFELPEVNILSAKAYLSLHLDRGSPNWDVVIINEGLCNITRDDMDLDAGSEGVFRTFDLSSNCFQSGNNSIKLDLRNLGYNAHIHPGTFFIITYNLTDTPEMLAWEHSERYYFDNVVSIEGGTGAGAGPWVIRPFHIPEDAENISVAIQVAGRNIRDYTSSCTPSRRFWGWGSSHCKRDYDYIMFLNSDTPFDSDSSPDVNPLYYYTPAQVASDLVDGTNLVAVYFNNYEDNVWGEDTETVYSDPINNASGSSYVEVNYSREPVLPYGVIEVRDIVDFGGEPHYTKDGNFSFPEEAEGVSDVYAHPVEQYSYITRVYSDTGYPPGNLVFESPASRAVPSSVFLPLDTIDTTPLVTNYVRIQEESWNEVLPNSTIDFGFYVKSAVGYGEVFSSFGESQQDAIDRLQEVLGSYVNASNMILENVSMSDVPSMWGPALIEVRVWT